MTKETLRMTEEILEKLFTVVDLEMVNPRCFGKITKRETILAGAELNEGQKRLVNCFRLCQISQMYTDRDRANNQACIFNEILSQNPIKKLNRLVGEAEELAKKGQLLADLLQLLNEKFRKTMVESFPTLAKATAIYVRNNYVVTYYCRKPQSL